MTSEEAEVVEVDKTTPSEGKAATLKSQKVTSHELPWYADQNRILIVLSIMR